MHLLCLNAAVLAVALLYCLYRTHLRVLQRNRRRLRERVTYMLWIVADRADKHETSLARP